MANGRPSRRTGGTTKTQPTYLVFYTEVCRKQPGILKLKITATFDFMALEMVHHIPDKKSIFTVILNTSANEVKSIGAQIRLVFTISSFAKMLTQLQLECYKLLLVHKDSRNNTFNAESLRLNFT